MVQALFLQPCHTAACPLGSFMVRKGGMLTTYLFVRGLAVESEVWRNKMNVGEPQRVIEVVPLHEPVPSEPKPVEPEKEPVNEPEKEPVEP